MRLSADHWVFKEENISKVVREALKLYRELHNEICDIKQSVQEVKEVLNSGQLIVQGMVKEEKPKSQDMDPRLMSVLDDFLDF